MAIADIANIPEDFPSEQTWTFSHLDHHRRLNDYIQQKHNQTLVLFPLDPIDPNNTGQWFYQHQQLHDAQNKILGIAGNNLLDVDWNDQAQRAAFVQVNFFEHLQACNLTGVS